MDDFLAFIRCKPANFHREPPLIHTGKSVAHTKFTKFSRKVCLVCQRTVLFVKLLQFAKCLRSQEQFVWNSEKSEQFLNRILFKLVTCYSDVIYTLIHIKMAIGTNIWNVETYRNKLENYHTVSVGMIWLEFSIE